MVGFPALLAILFIALKLTHVIAWSWLWVLAPLWLGLAVVLAVVIFTMCTAGALAALSVFKSRKISR